MDLELDAKNILEMRLIKTCICESSYSEQMKKQLTKFIEDIITTLNKENKVEVNVILETDTSSSEDEDDYVVEEKWED
tara:strand:+ start:5704 stop:5937 length:234 start_codon:yes stop_codon:yes gene_type:complete